MKMSESSREVDKKPPVKNNQITQNVKDLLSSREVENIFENSDFVYMLNQAGGDRQILAKQLCISPHQLSYVTHSGTERGWRGGAAPSDRNLVRHAGYTGRYHF